MSQDFVAALEAAVIAQNRKAQVRTALLGLAVAGVYGTLFLVHQPLFGAIPVVAGVVIHGWMAVTERLPAQKALTRFRGAQVSHWLPSPSHGVVFATDKAAVVPGEPEMAFDRLAPHFLQAVAYDEARRQLIFTCQRHTSNSQGEDFVGTKQVRVKVAASGEAAYAFARELDRLTQP